MAFKDIEKVLYDGTIKLDYKDKAHRYYVRERVSSDLPENDKKAWGKIIYPKGVTTLIDETLEKKGLLTWPLGLAMRELFGFYDFKNKEGEQMTGFSKGVGTLWSDGHSLSVDQETLLPLVKSANEAWRRRQKKGADIGSVVHDAIEHFIKNQDFDIAEQYNWNIKESGLEDEALDAAFAEAPQDVEFATKAFLEFQKWWLTVAPTLHGAEDLLYSKELNVAGTYDGDISIPVEHHPVFSQPTEKVSVAFSQVYTNVANSKFVRCTADWKTSNASTSELAAMPEGVSYQYFIQSAIYELIRREMGMTKADDLVIVSARKDGGFSVIYASELGLSVEDCIAWARATITCYRMMDKTKRGLVAHAQPAKAEGEF